MGGGRGRVGWLLARLLFGVSEWVSDGVTSKTLGFRGQGG